MPQLFSPKHTIKIVPKEGEIEITLNINITIDGKVVASADNATVVPDDDKAPHIIPDFTSGLKLNFGKQDGSP